MATSFFIAVPTNQFYNNAGLLESVERRLTMTMQSEEIRLRYLYRRLLIDGKVRISFEAARRLVGPDCAYHLYAVVGKTERNGCPRASRSRKK
jgi:hypothetical protein